MEDRRLNFAAALGVALILGAGASDFVLGSFWEHHSLVTSLLANVLVLAVTVIVVNQVVERRDRQRWNLLAQSVLFALIQSARATWTTMIEVLELAEVESGAVEPLLHAAELARDSTRVSQAADELLADSQRRARLQTVVVNLSEHASEVIAKWAPVMVSARPYAEVLDRHVELAGRLEWLSSVLAHNDPPADQSRRDRTLTRSSVGAEHAEELGTDEWLHDQILAVMRLATNLDYESREHAYSIAPMSWWAERTEGLVESEPPPPASFG
jgi:hypothetical protein